jgi:catechol 2,3-dioxygenase
MPVPAPNLNPDFNIVRLSHVEYNVRDLAASRAFYVDTLGLQVTHETETPYTCARWRNVATTVSI